MTAMPDGSRSAEPAGSADGLKTDPVRIEALLLAAVGIAASVYALFPADVSGVVRCLLAGIVGLLVLVLLGRYPALSRWLVAVLIKIGPFLIVAMFAAVVLILVHPGLRPSDAATSVMVAGGAAAVFHSFDISLAVREVRDTMPLRRYGAVGSAHTVLGFGAGCLACIIVRTQPGGVAFTNHLPGTLLVGISSASIYIVVLAMIGRLAILQMPADKP